jgi:hypothetical protein
VTPARPASTNSAPVAGDSVQASRQARVRRAPLRPWPSGSAWGTPQAVSWWMTTLRRRSSRERSGSRRSSASVGSAGLERHRSAGRGPWPIRHHRSHGAEGEMELLRNRSGSTLSIENGHLVATQNFEEGVGIFRRQGPPTLDEDGPRRRPPTRCRRVCKRERTALTAFLASVRADKRRPSTVVPLAAAILATMTLLRIGACLPTPWSPPISSHCRLNDSQGNRNRNTSKDPADKYIPLA